MCCIDDELSGLRESEEKLKQQQVEATRRENVLVMRLTAKEQEMQEYMVNSSHQNCQTIFRTDSYMKDNIQDHIARKAQLFECLQPCNF